MDSFTAYAETLKAATASVDALLSMLPDPTWGDSITGEEQTERDTLQEISGLLSGASMPFDSRRRVASFRGS